MHAHETKRRKTKYSGSYDMAQWVKVPTTKPEDLSLILGFHMIEGESQPQQVLYVLYVMECVCVHLT